MESEQKRKTNMKTYTNTLVIIHIIASILVILITIAGCNQQMMSKNYGGSMEIELDQGKKLVNCTWKDTDMWILVTDRATNEVAKTYEFVEKSTYGVMEGKITIKEK